MLRQPRPATDELPADPGENRPRVHHPFRRRDRTTLVKRTQWRDHSVEREIIGPPGVNASDKGSTNRVSTSAPTPVTDERPSDTSCALACRGSSRSAAGRPSPARRAPRRGRRPAGRSGSRTRGRGAAAAPILGSSSPGRGDGRMDQVVAQPDLSHQLDRLRPPGQQRLGTAVNVSPATSINRSLPPIDPAASSTVTRGPSSRSRRRRPRPARHPAADHDDVAPCDRPGHPTSLPRAIEASGARRRACEPTRGSRA